MSQSRTSRRGRVRRRAAGERHRVAAGAQARPQGAGAGRGAPRGGRGASASSGAAARRAPARPSCDGAASSSSGSSASKLFSAGAPPRSPAPAGPRSRDRSLLGARRGGPPHARPLVRLQPSPGTERAAGRAGARWPRHRSSGGEYGSPRSSSGSSAGSKTAANTRSKVGSWACGGDEYGPRRPVELASAVPARRAPPRGRSARRVPAWRGRPRRAAAVAERRGQGREVDRSSSHVAHWGGSALPCIAAQTRAGFSGMSMWATPWL